MILPKLFIDIAATYHSFGDAVKGTNFLRENKKYLCGDGTYNCLNARTLFDIMYGYYEVYENEEALELINMIILQSEEELVNVGNTIVDKIQPYFKGGMIYMKWGEFDKSIEYFTNALNISIANQSDDYSWHVTYYRRLGLVHYYMDDYQKASNYYLEAFELSDNVDDNKAMKSICSYGYISELMGEGEAAKSMMSQCESLVLDNLETLQNKDDPDYEAYETLWPLYLYYKKMNQPQEASKYLNMAYEITGIEKINKYHKHPNKEIDPRFFYCRDIIKAYDNEDK